MDAPTRCAGDPQCLPVLGMVGLKAPPGGHKVLPWGSETWASGLQHLFMHLSAVCVLFCDVSFQIFLLHSKKGGVLF